MPSRSELARNNVRAGLFVLIAIAIIVWVIIVLTGAVEMLTRRYDDYSVTYRVDEGVSHLKSGSDVRVGGLVLGKVGEVVPETGAGKRLERIRVQFQVDARVRLFQDARVYVRAPLIGADAWLDVVDVGSAEKGAAAGGVLVGASGGGALSSLLGPQAEEVLDNTVAFTEFLAGVPQDYDRLVVPALEDARNIAHDAAAEKWPAWAARVSDIMTWAGSFTGRLDEGLADGRNLVGDLQATVAENREPLHATLDNAKAASADMRAVAETARTQTVERVHALIQSGQDALDKTGELAGRVQQDYEQWAVGLGDTFANAGLASTQLKLALAELRRSPWKLVYRPEPAELEHEMLYEATRSFAMAAADLGATAEALNRVLDHHGRSLSGQEPAIVRMKDNLEASFRNYERAQQALFDVLVTDLK